MTLVPIISIANLLLQQLVAVWQRQQALEYQ